MLKNLVIQQEATIKKCLVLLFPKSNTHLFSQQLCGHSHIDQRTNSIKYCLFVDQSATLQSVFDKLERWSQKDYRCPSCSRESTAECCTSYYAETIVLVNPFGYDHRLSAPSEVWFKGEVFSCTRVDSRQEVDITCSCSTYWVFFWRSLHCLNFAFKQGIFSWIWIPLLAFSGTVSVIPLWPTAIFLSLLAVLLSWFTRGQEVDLSLRVVLEVQRYHSIQSVVFSTNMWLYKWQFTRM